MTPTRLSPQTVSVLAEFLKATDEWRYGYDLMRATGMAAGTLYPILQRLADEGWLKTQWESRGEGGRPPRHLYRITGAGVRGGRAMVQRATQRGWQVAGPIVEGA